MASKYKKVSLTEIAIASSSNISNLRKSGSKRDLHKLDETSGQNYRYYPPYLLAIYSDEDNSDFECLSTSNGYATKDLNFDFDERPAKKNDQYTQQNNEEPKDKSDFWETEEWITNDLQTCYEDCSEADFESTLSLPPSEIFLQALTIDETSTIKDLDDLDTTFVCDEVPEVDFELEETKLYVD